MEPVEPADPSVRIPPISKQASRKGRLMIDIVLQQPDLRLSFVAALLQYVYDLQQMSLQHLLLSEKLLVSLQTSKSLCLGSAALVLELLNNNCHLYNG